MSAPITMRRDTSLLHLETATLRALPAEQPALAPHLIGFLSHRLRQANDALR